MPSPQARNKWMRGCQEFINKKGKNSIESLPFLFYKGEAAFDTSAHGTSSFNFVYYYLHSHHDGVDILFN